jgi:predicted RNA-binding Zn-ribbon protein involved in translation (DUF1610 family)
MAYRLPSSEELMVALYKALTRRGTIDSQRQLREAVLRELQKWDQTYTVSHRRVRLAAIRAGFVNMEIMSREGEGTKTQQICPVCGTRLKTVRNRSLWGKEVTIGYRCPTCGYKSGVKKQVPIRYIFHLDENMPRASTLKA